MNEKIILALDTTNIEEAINITKKIKSKIYTIKIGLEFWNAYGKECVKKFNETRINNLMLYLKLKDIPNTVYKSIKALEGINFSYLTVHGQGGKAMIEGAKKAASEIKSQPTIMMVTILTALNDIDLKIMGINSNVNEQIKILANLAKKMDVGVICSGNEAKYVRKILGRHNLIFTPGIRMMNENVNDQQRVCTPNESLLNGADKIIMGRSLIDGDIIKNLNNVTSSIKI